MTNRTEEIGVAFCGHPGCAPLGDTPTSSPVQPTWCQLARIHKHGLCPDCAEQWGAWLDYKIQKPINLVQIGNPTPARIREDQEATYREWKSTIDFQQALIVKICAIRHHWTAPVITVELP